MALSQRLARAALQVCVGTVSSDTSARTDPPREGGSSFASSSRDLDRWLPLGFDEVLITCKSLSLERVWGKEDACEHEPHLAMVPCATAVALKPLQTLLLLMIALAEAAEGKAVEDAFKENDSEWARGAGGFRQQGSITRGNPFADSSFLPLGHPPEAGCSNTRSCK